MSNRFDKMLPGQLQIDGNTHFKEVFSQNYFKEGITIYDIGGGKQPFLTLGEKEKLHISVTGIDIDEQELKRAERGLYDRVICADFASTMIWMVF